MFQLLRTVSRSTVQYIQGSTNNPSLQRQVSRESEKETYLSRHISLDEQSIVQIEETAEKARDLITDWHPLCELKEMLLGCPHTAEVVNARDGAGYTLLQHAIICQRPRMVQWLVTQGAELNSPTCGRPIHLAAKLGDAEILKMLLDYNADPCVVSCVCYPEKHVDARTVYSSHGKHWYTTCGGDVFSQDKLTEHQFEYPLHYAIQSNSVECLKLLLARHACQLKSSVPALHLACSFGSMKCVRFLCDSTPGELHMNDKNSMLPIQHGVKWGKDMVEYLVLSGASIHVKTKHNATLLHLLFSKMTSCSGLANTVSYLIDCGLKMNINALDIAGNSALNLLLLSMHQQVQWHLPPSETDSLDSEEHEYFKSLCLLLEAGQNPNIANRVGDTSLHVLARIIPHTVNKSSGKTSQSRKCHTRLRLVYNLLEKLLTMAANPNLLNNSEGTLLGLLVLHGANVVFSSLEEDWALPQSDELGFLIRSIQLLHHHKCNFDSCRYMGSGCLLHIVLGHLDRLDELAGCSLTPEQQTDFATSYVDSLKKLTTALLECGCKPNVCRCVQTDLHTLYYKVMSKHTILPLSCIRDFVLVFLHYGADPNVGGKHIPMSVFRYRSSHSYWPVFPLLHIMNMIGCHDMTEKETDLLSLMHVFYNSMNESNSKQCIFHYLEYDRIRNRACKYPDFDDYLLKLLNTPSSLRRLCACTVYSDIAERRVSNLIRMQLPKSLIRYITSFEY